MTNQTHVSERLTIVEAQKQVADTVTKALNNAPNPVCEMTSHLAAAQGKGVRTLLLLYCAMESDGLVSHDAVLASASIELFHLATLVHDDVIDDATLRRGIPTVQFKFGRKQAVICGDYLLCLATSLVAPLHVNYKNNDNILTTFASALSRTCLGELKQFHNNRNLELEIPDYLRIIAGKTASLFYVSALAGAIIARYDYNEVRRLSRFGRYLGMVFQIVDDCKDYEFSEDKALKTVGKDIIEGVITLPLIYAFRSSPQLRQLAKDAFDDADSANRLVKAVCDTGATSQALNLASRYSKKAKDLLKPFPEDKTGFLLGLLNKSMGAANVF